MSAGTLHFVVPGDIDTPTGGYGYDRAVAAGLRDAGWTVEIVSLPGSWPHTDDGTLAAAAKTFATLPNGAVVLVDGLAYARLPDLMGREAGRLSLAALVHHPLADEGGLPADLEAAFERDERSALHHAALVICTSRTTGDRLMSHYGIEAGRLVVAPPGTEPLDLDISERRRDRLLCVASIVPRKGHDVLIDALSKIADLDWSLRLVGPSRDADWRGELERRIARLGLDDRIEFTGGLADLSADYARAGIFVLATRHEGYGMAYAEALSAGLPVVGCAVGAVPEVVPPSAGALVARDDADGFARALRRLLTDDAAYGDAVRGARAAAAALPRWRDTTARIHHALFRLSGAGDPT